MKQYDVIIIGAGPAGLAAAYPLAERKRVLVIENDLWGGTCPNRGCDPKKMLYGAVATKDLAARMTRAGLEGIPDVNWPKLMAFKRRYTDAIPTQTREGLSAAGIDTVHGTPRFDDAQTLLVDGERYRAEAIIIATGRTPRLPDIVGHELLQTSSEFLNLDQLPQTIAFIGAGLVSLELANIAASAGAKVHIINRTKRALRQFPEELGTQLRPLMAAKHIVFHDDVAVTAINQAPDGRVSLRGDGDFALTVQLAIAATGRKPATDLGLAQAGVAESAAGIAVDAYMQTNVPHIYAIGDVVAKTQPKLTPVAAFEGRYLAAHLLGDPAPIAYPAIPEVLFGVTELAQVGVSAQEAAAHPEVYTVTTRDVTQWYTYRRTLEAAATVTIVEHQETGLIVGAAVLAADAEDLINDLTLLINAQVPAKKAKAAIYAYPSALSDLPYLL